MLVTNSQADHGDYTSPIYGHLGEYALDTQQNLRYFSANISLQNIDLLHTVEELSPSLDENIPIDEIFQRELDGKRVTEKLVNSYLLNHEKLRFFNSLTVVLFPIDSNDKIQQEFANATQDYPDFEKGEDAWAGLLRDGKLDDLSFSGVQLHCLNKDSNSRLRWDKQTIRAIPVDGQHRLAALKELSRSSGLDAEHRRRTKIPVLFVLLHENAGLKQPIKANVQKNARVLFTDLNKHAKRIPESRQVILDDLSIPARCTRRVLAKATASDERAESRLPLSLIDWMNEGIKFDTGPYITTVVQLHKIISRTLLISPPNDPLKAKDASNYVKAIKGAFPTIASHMEGSRDLDRELKERFGYKKDDEDLDRSFALEEGWVDAAERSFEEHHLEWIYALMTEFPPYKAILQYASDKDLIEGTFAKYRAMSEVNQQNWKKGRPQDWEETNILPYEKAITRMKSDHWGFRAIFQDALARLAKQLCYDHKSQEWAGIENFKEFLAWVSLPERDLLRIHSELKRTGEKLDSTLNHLWRGIAINPGGATGVDPSKATIKKDGATISRIQATLTVWYFQFLSSRDIKTDPWTKDCEEKINKARTGILQAGARTIFNDAQDKVKEPLGHATMWSSKSEAEITKRVNAQYRDILWRPFIPA